MNRILYAFHPHEYAPLLSVYAANGIVTVNVIVIVLVLVKNWLCWRWSKLLDIDETDDGDMDWDELLGAADGECEAEVA